MNNGKTLYYITGPIGVGKSTLANAFITLCNLRSLEFISTDLYYYLLFMRDKSSTEENYKNAKEYCTYKLEKAIASDKSFVWESVLAKKEKIDFLQQCIDKDYSIVSIFVGLDGYPDLLKRVKKRHSEGWYDIPIQKVIDRYNVTMEKIQILYNLSTEFVAVDAANNQCQLVLYKNDYGIQYFLNSCVWINQYLNIEIFSGSCSQNLSCNSEK